MVGERADVLPSRLALAPEFLVALTFSLMTMVRMSPTLRGRRSSNSALARGLSWKIAPVARAAAACRVAVGARRHRLVHQRLARNLRAARGQHCGGKQQQRARGRATATKKTRALRHHSWASRCSIWSELWIALLLIS